MIKLFNLPLSIIAKIRPSMWISAVLATCFGIYFYTQQHDSDNRTSASDKEQLELVLADIEYRWVEGFLKSEIDFSKYTDIPAREFIYEVSKCNPKLLELYLRGALRSKPMWKTKSYLLVKDTMQTSEGRVTTFTLLDQKKNEEVHLRLSHQCREIKLPKKKYSAGPKNIENFIWDNFSYDIYIDRFYVSQTEVFKWKEARGIEYQHKLSKENISTQLSLSERHQFCVDKGGLLLQSHVFDAAVFYPTEVHLNKKNYKFKYPWGREDFDFKLVDKANCEKFPVGECYQKFQYTNYEPIGTSWSGIYFAIGGWPESFHNINQPEANLKVSSKFLDMSSHWHENGLRAHWSGKVNFPNSINLTEQNFGRLIPADNIEGVAFRCMYYR